MTVEGHAGLQAQGVATGQTRGHETNGAARIHERLPERYRVADVDEQFETVFAGVPRATDQNRLALEARGYGSVVLEVGERRRADFQAEDAHHRFIGLWPLQGEQGGLVAHIVQFHVKVNRALLERRPRGLPIARVCHHEVLERAGAINNQVVDDPAVFVEEESVFGLAKFERREPR